MTKKSNIIDVCQLIDTKPNSDDVFKVMEEIKSSVEHLHSKI